MRMFIEGKRKSDQSRTTLRIIAVRLRMPPAVDVISRSSQEVKASLAPCSYENGGIPFHSDDEAKKHEKKQKLTRPLGHDRIPGRNSGFRNDRNSDACRQSHLQTLNDPNE